MNAAPVAAANRRFSKIVRSSIGARPWRSMSTNSGSSTTPAIRPPITTGSFQPLIPPLETPSVSPVRPATNVVGAEDVEPAVGVAPGELVEHAVAPGGAEQRERHVEPEHPVPRDRDERAAEHRPEHEPDRGDHRVRPHREPELLARERVGDERGGVGEQERGADALEDPPQDQLGAVLGEAGAQRGEREDDEAADVGLLAAEEVGEPARGEHEHGRGDHVGEDHPHEAEQRRVERALEVGQGDDQRARVDGRQQHAQAGAGERPPLVVGVLRVDPESVFHVNVKFSDCLPCRHAAERARPVSDLGGLDRGGRAREHDRPRAPLRGARLPPLLAGRAPRRADAGGAVARRC